MAHPFCKAASFALVAGTPQLCFNQLQFLTLAVKNLSSSSSFPVSSDKLRSLQVDWREASSWAAHRAWLLFRNSCVTEVPLGSSHRLVLLHLSSSAEIQKSNKDS